MDAHATAECAGCDWERHAQAFRWFPELGAPLELAGAMGVDHLPEGCSSDQAASVAP
jgi:hypothetical protein